MNMVTCWKYFVVCISLTDISASTQAVKLKFRRNEFEKKILQTRICFQKNLRNQIDEIIGQFNHESIHRVFLNVSFTFISCQEICKLYVVMINPYCTKNEVSIKGVFSKYDQIQIMTSQVLLQVVRTILRQQMPS